MSDASGISAQQAVSTPAATPTPPPTDTAAWLSKITDAEIVGAAQTKGWDKLDPTEAFAQAVKAHRSAEKMLGAPPDQLVRLPTRPDDEAGWRSVWQRLGAPEKAEDYDFSTVKLESPEVTERFTAALRGVAAEMNMPKAMAERMAQHFNKFVADQTTAKTAESTAALHAEQSKLAADWGQPGGDRWRANMFVADEAAAKLGVSPDALAKLKDGIGGAAVAQMFHKIGLAMGEDKYVAGTNPANQGIMSREQAVARRTELMADREWSARYLAGGAPEMREMLALNTILTGGP